MVAVTTTIDRTDTDVDLELLVGEEPDLPCQAWIPPEHVERCGALAEWIMHYRGACACPGSTSGYLCTVCKEDICRTMQMLCGGCDGLVDVTWVERIRSPR